MIIDQHIEVEFDIRPAKISVRYHHVGETFFETFTDWYDFADWLKERQINHKATIILGWEYIEREAILIDWSEC